MRTVQRVFRGFLARRRVRQLKKVEAEQKLLRFFHDRASLIQKIFRGFLIRKHVCNFQERKQFIAASAAKAHAVRQEAEQFSQTLRMQMEQEEEERKRREFEETAASLSHLRSTSAIPGVFGSKTGITTAEAFGAPVEELLTQTAKKTAQAKMQADRKTLRQRLSVGSLRPHDHVSSAASPVAGTGTDRGQRKKTIGPFKPAIVVESMKQRALGCGVNASVPYQEDEEVRRFERRVENKFLQATSKGSCGFQYRKADPLKPVTSIHLTNPSDGLGMDHGSSMRSKHSSKSAQQKDALPPFRYGNSGTLFDGSVVLTQAPAYSRR